tara:strand:- start:1473 stop:2756 length:1284 start_codon:yes stop_codon:yes gene_type:complete
MKSLEDITSRIGDGLHGTPKYDDSGDYYFINGNNLSQDKITLKKETRRVSKEEYLKHKKDLNERTLLVSINGTLGNFAFYNNEKVMLGKSACYLNLIDDVDKEYIGYLLKNRHFQKYIDSNATGTTIKNVSLQTIRSYEFELPPKKNQQDVSNFLSSFDRKIELNKKMNETLEDIAKTLFKSWFIDFDPVRAKAEGRPTGLSKEISDLFPDSYEGSELGEIPKGWKASQVKDFCSVIQKGIAPKYTENQSYPVINQKCIRNLEINFDLCRFTEYKKVMEDRYLENFDILLNSMGTGTLGRSALFVEHHTKAVVDGCISVIRGKSKNFSLYVYQSISRREDEIINLSQGSTGQTTLKTEDIGNLNLIQPTNELIELFGKSVADLHLKKYSNSQENKVLSNLRDTLLPKLISGELKISDTENLIKEAGI